MTVLGSWGARILLALFCLSLGIVGCNGGGGSSLAPQPSGPTVAPTGFSAGFAKVAVRIGWNTNIPTGVTATRIYRAPVDASGTVGTYVRQADVDLDTFEWIDSQITEGATYSYKGCFIANGLEGLSSLARLGPIEVLPPGDLKVAAGSNQSVLSWTNRSTRITAIRIYRRDGGSSQSQLLVTLTSDAQEYTDSASPAGYYSYYLIVEVEGSVGGSTQEAHAWVMSSENPLHLTSQVLASPLATSAWMDRDASGRWFSQNYSELTYQDSQLKWKSIHTTFNAAGWAAPGLKLDAAGKPHALWYEGAAATSQPLKIYHGWLDGTSWKSELITQRALQVVSGSTVFAFTLAPNGSLHAFWQCQPSRPGYNSIEYATNESGAWMVTPVTSALIDLETAQLGMLSIGAAVDGSVHLGIPVTNQVLLKCYVPGKGWSEEIAPTSPVRAGAYDSVLVLPVDQGGLDLVYHSSENQNIWFSVMYLSKRQGTWGAPENLAQRGYSNGIPKLWGAITKDGSRTVVGMDVPNSLASSLLLLSRNLNTNWERTTLSDQAPDELYLNLVLGFDGSNRLFAMIPCQDYAEGEMHHPVFAEGPYPSGISWTVD